ncbi:precursor to secretory protein Ssp120 [Punctularia strigosozonata HHB-11173 SS5]|uniref:precursor to secretory protein Ssp120 n=1 Tax=Punctularia strigosozonata (strain HHB-11173) TaxID=741275 RepID=UPI0004416AAB|nr:precursor to secretory protein Ssp120 [Punctularia strigosozonata HHB-11173 SS5]EIN14359.1 precursor to secretory protein Ssp120 [Punctularia strigosozonata HHB-11173 SS5]
MKRVSALLVLTLLGIANAHGEHGKAEGETIQQYAQRHMSTEHHIDTFDLGSFFHLHDLNRDGFWDKEEIEAIYGVHHVYNRKKSKDEEEHQRKADHIVNTVLAAVDKDKDGKISREEFEKAGLDALPNFEELGAEGHHYDVESEFFLHHEEIYHNTPETQTDESYTHPEDLEHFAHHEEIERKEAEKEAAYQGISVEEAIAQHEEHEAPPPSQPDSQVPLADDVPAGNIAPAPPHDDQQLSDQPLKEPPLPKVTRVTPPEKMDPVERYREAKKASGEQEGWGQGNSGYKAPKTPTERMRKNLPYKERMQYKFKKQWGDF